MNVSLILILEGFMLFQIKHYIVDYLTQNEYQLANKANYSHPGGYLHAGLHAVASLPAIFLFGPTLSVVVLLVVGEFLVHYHIDFAKGRIDKARNWQPSDRQYWAVFGLDQFFHQSTYIVMVAVLAGAFA